MKGPSIVLAGFIIGALLITSTFRPAHAQPASPSSGSAPPLSPQTETVKKYLEGCRNKPAKDTGCEKLRKDAIEILQEDLRTLGSSADRGYLLSIVPVFQSEEVELRIAAADAIGMIGPQDRDTEFLAPVTNDPVPDVRAAVGQAISRGKGSALTLLGQRVRSWHQTGLTPEIPPDAAKFAMPVAPDSDYLFYASNPAVGRLSYVGKSTNDPASFFKGKAKKGPFKLEEFQEKYRYQLQDEQEALNREQDAQAKQMENVKPPDPTNTQALMEHMEKVTSVSAGRTTRMLLDSYQPDLFGSPTVYVLEERQIGQRSYPTRYVVVYHEQALKKPGYRLSWTTVPDSALKTAQVTSLAQEKEEMANKAESEAVKKKQAELEALTKKKDEQEKKKFKKGQADLEKELGF